MHLIQKRQLKQQQNRPASIYQQIRLIFVSILPALLLILLLSPLAQATPADFIGTPLDALQYTNINGIEQFLAELDQMLDEHWQGFSLRALWQNWLEGDLSFDFQFLLSALMRLFFQEVLASTSLLAQLIGVALLSVLLTTLKGSFAGSDISQIGRAVVFLVLVGVAISSFSIALTGARTAVNNISDFIHAALPVLLPLLVALGGVGTAGIVQPTLLLVLSLLMNLMNNFIFPLIYFSAILRLVGQISPKLNIDKLAGLLRDLAMGVMSIAVTLFIAFLSLGGLAAAAMDGLAVRALKAAAGVFIPVVGRSLADAFDSVLSTALLLKNVIGLIGAVALLVICALPALRILVQMLIYRLAAAILQPLGEEQLSNALSGLSNSLLLLFAVLAISGLFAFFAIAIVIGAGNLTMVLR